MSITLYETVNALAIVTEWLDESGGEITPEIEDLLAEAEGDFTTKAERVALYIRSLDAEAEAIKAEEARLAARRKVRENGAERLKGYLHRWIEAAGRDSVKTPLITAAIQTNPPKVECDLQEGDLVELGANGLSYVKSTEVITISLDKKAILADHKAGTLQGLPAGIRVTQSTSLRIR
jgi:hypothetical protein